MEKKEKNIDKIKQIEIKLVKTVYANIPSKLQSELKELNKKHIVDLNLHEIKNDKSRDYTGDFEMVGKLSIGDIVQTTHKRFTNSFDYEVYLKSIDERYASNDSFFNGHIHILNTS